MILYELMKNYSKMKQRGRESVSPQRRALGVVLAGVVLSGCSSQESVQSMSPKPGISDAEISSLRDAPVPEDMPTNEYTRAVTCGVEAVRIATAEVLEQQTGEVNETGGIYFSEADNPQSSYVSVESIAEGVTRLKLEVAMDTTGKIHQTPEQAVGFGVRGVMTVMDSTNESWVKALETTRPDQVGFPTKDSLAVWNLQTNDGGTVEQPQTICEATEALKTATR